MAATKPIARVAMHFSGKDHPELVRTEVRLAPKYLEDEMVICRRGKRINGRKNVFQHTPGPKATGILFVRYAAWCSRRKNPRLFVFRGPSGSPADTLETTVMQKDGSLDWSSEMFCVKNHHTLLWQIVDRHTPRKPANDKDFEHAVDYETFPSEALTIIWDGRLITDPSELERLAAKLEAQWEDKRYGGEAAANLTPPRPVDTNALLPAVSPSLSHTPVENVTERAPSAPPIQKVESSLHYEAAPKPFEPQTATQRAPDLQTLEVLGEDARASFSNQAVFPFSVLSPNTTCFIKRRQFAYTTTKTTYQKIFYERMPHFAKFSSVKSILERDRWAVIRGTQGSGRTTMALQMAVEFMRNGAHALYLDLSATNFTPQLLHSAFAALESCSKRPCLLVIDNIDTNRNVVTEFFTAWKSRPGESRLLLVSVWAPLLANGDADLPAFPDEMVIDIHPTRDDLIRAYIFWRNYCVGEKGKVLHQPIQPHLFGALVGRLCLGVETYLSAQSRSYDMFSIYEAGEVVTELRHGSRRVRDVSFIRDYLWGHPEEKTSAMSFRGLIEMLDGGRLTESIAIVQSLSRLSEHPVARWYYILEPFKEVVELLGRSHRECPPIYIGYRQALERDPKFSFRMATRVLDPKYNAVCSYVAFAEQCLPEQHKSHLVECLYNAGPSFLFESAGCRDVDSLVSLLWFTYNKLPAEFLKGLMAGWREPKKHARLQWLIARVATTGRENVGRLAQDRMLEQLIGKELLLRIAVDPKPFINLFPLKGSATS